jgi:endonuclease YncB( thermonuclease family)
MFLLGLAAGALVGPGLPRHTAARAATDMQPVPAPASDILAPLRTAYPAQVVRVLDGDTFEARVNVWPGLDTTTKVRLRGIDAPELRARCPQELAKAQAARDALIAILDEGAVGVARVTLDKYGGRVVADASTRKTADVSAALLRLGLVRGYGGGRRESWCTGTSG